VSTNREKERHPQCPTCAGRGEVAFDDFDERRVLCADCGGSGVLLPLALIAPTHRHEVLCEINAERTRQDAKWGEQNHPDVDRVLTDRGPSPQDPVRFPGGCSPRRMAEHYGVPTTRCAKAECDGAAEIGQCTWAHILVEEVAEAIEAACESQQGRMSVDALRAELVQVAAVAVSWIEAIDRRKAVTT